MRLHCLKVLRKEPVKNRTRSFSNAKELLKSFQINEHILKNKKKENKTFSHFFWFKLKEKLLNFVVTDL